MYTNLCRMVAVRVHRFVYKSSPHDCCISPPFVYEFFGQSLDKMNSDSGLLTDLYLATLFRAIAAVLTVADLVPEPPEERRGQ